MFERFSKPRPKLEGDPFIKKLAESIASIQSQYEGLTSHVQSRDYAIKFPAISRCTFIISNIIASLLCNGSLEVRDHNDKKIDTRRTQNILKLFTGKPDRLFPAFTFFEDCVADYCLDGNSLIATDRLGSQIKYMHRYSSRDAYTKLQNSSSSLFDYYAYKAFSMDGALEIIPSPRMAHVRFPILQSSGRSNSANSRMLFAIAPTILISEAIRIGRKQELSLSKWLDKPTMHVNFDQELATRLSEEQKKDIKAKIREEDTSGQVLVTFGGDSSPINPPIQETKEQRNYQVEEIARFYGMPMPLLSVPVGQWSRGINEQIMKLAWRTGLNLHFNRFSYTLGTHLLNEGEYFRPDVTEFIRGDASGIAELANATQGDAQRNPILSRGELRHMTGAPREPEDDIKDTVIPGMNTDNPET